MHKRSLASLLILASCFEIFFNFFPGEKSILASAKAMPISTSNVVAEAHNDKSNAGAAKLHLKGTEPKFAAKDFSSTFINDATLSLPNANASSDAFNTIINSDTSDNFANSNPASLFASDLASDPATNPNPNTELNSFSNATTDNIAITSESLSDVLNDHIKAELSSRENKAAQVDPNAANEAIIIPNANGTADLKDYLGVFKQGEFSLLTSFKSAGPAQVTSLFFLSEAATLYRYFSIYLDKNGRVGYEMQPKAANVAKPGRSAFNNQANYFDNVTHRLGFAFSLKKRKLQIRVDDTLLFDEQFSEQQVNALKTDLLDKITYAAIGTGKRNNQPAWSFTGSFKDNNCFERALSPAELANQTQAQVLAVPATNLPYVTSEPSLLNKLANLDEFTITTTFLGDPLGARSEAFCLSDDKGQAFSVWFEPKSNSVGVLIKHANANDSNYILLDKHLKKANISISPANMHTYSVVKLTENGKNRFKFYVDGVYIDTYGNKQDGINTIELPKQFSVAAIGDAELISRVDVKAKALSDTEIKILHQTKAKDRQRDLTKEHQLAPAKPLFYSGFDNSKHYRIPVLQKTQAGTLIAVSDKRQTTYSDYGDIDIVVRRKPKTASQFSEPITALDLDFLKSGAFNIDSSLVQAQTGELLLFVDMFPKSTALMAGDSIAKAGGSGYLQVGDKHYLKLDDANGKTYTVRENGKVYDEKGTLTNYRAITALTSSEKPAEKGNGAFIASNRNVSLSNNVSNNGNNTTNHTNTNTNTNTSTTKEVAQPYYLDDLAALNMPYHELGSLYEAGQYVGNIYNQNAPLRVMKTSYLWMLRSNDDGQTWSYPIDLNASVKPEWAAFMGTGPGSGLCLDNGRLIVPIYTINSQGWFNSQATGIIYSDDNGENWHFGPQPVSLLGKDPSQASNLPIFTEAQACQLNNGDVYLFMRNQSQRLKAAVSHDRGTTFSEIKTFDAVFDSYCQMSNIHFNHEGKEYLLHLGPSKGNRQDGALSLAEITYNAKNEAQFNWQPPRLLAAGHFQYSDLAALTDTEFAALYELDGQPSGGIQLYYQTFNLDWLKATNDNSLIEAINAKSALAYYDEAAQRLDLTIKTDVPAFALGKVTAILSLDDQQFNAELVGYQANELYFSANIEEALKDNIKTASLKVQALGANIEKSGATPQIVNVNGEKLKLQTALDVARSLEPLKWYPKLEEAKQQAHANFDLKSLAAEHLAAEDAALKQLATLPLNQVQRAKLAALEAEINGANNNSEIAPEKVADLANRSSAFRKTVIDAQLIAANLTAFKEKYQLAEQPLNQAYSELGAAIEQAEIDLDKFNERQAWVDTLAKLSYLAENLPARFKLELYDRDAKEVAEQALTPSSVHYLEAASNFNLPKLERAGYKFKAWTLLDGSTYNEEQVVMNKHWQLYATWEKIVPPTSETTAATEATKITETTETTETTEATDTKETTAVTETTATTKITETTGVTETTETSLAPLISETTLQATPTITNEKLVVPGARETTGTTVLKSAAAKTAKFTPGIIHKVTSANPPVNQVRKTGEAPYAASSLVLISLLIACLYLKQQKNQASPN